MRLKGLNKAITIINIHAPTEEKDEEIKNEFYERLETIMNNITDGDIKIIMGDANAKIGKEDIYRNITGGESKHMKSNDNGERLISLAIEKNMKIMSTHFKRKDIHKGTWMIPGSSKSNQIDHVLIADKYSRQIKNLRTFSRG
ncbi:unnamed protein product [Brassicogethes aeneus]|uniref:Craniofacial development protein 2-like n=1 Tax=Brassicogethes aeneus TaxID=1431903 RepID=A0A9P0FFZ6_BRAAE|nr:unnamed protein product [Brassicogethes aeneus]